MKRIIIAILILFSLQSFATKWYCTTTVSGSNVGSLSNPFYTAAAMNGAAYAAGDSVLFKRGDVFEWYVQVTESGSSGNPINFGAYGTGALPIITGGTTISSGSFSSIGGGIYEASLAVRPALIVISNRQYKEGRYPNDAYLNADAVSSNHLTSSGLTGQTGLVNADVVTRNGRFTMDRFTITSQVGNTIGFGGNIDQDYGFFITNKQSTLDQYGEWFYNSSTNKLLVYFGGAGASAVSVPVRDHAMQISGQSYINFSYISFQFGQQTASQALVDLQNNDHIGFYNCEFKFAGKNGIRGGGNGNDQLTVSNCLIQDINASGIQIYGNVSSDNMLITGNTFLRCGMFQGQGENGEYVALALQNENVDNCTITLNSFDSIGYHAITSGAGTNLLVYKNNIDNFCYWLDDGGAIYIQNTTGDLNKIIRRNICRFGGARSGEGTDAPTSNQAYCIYSDHGNSNTTIDSNYLEQAGAGVFMDNSPNVNIRANTIYKNKKGITVEYYDYLPITAITGLVVKKNIIYADTDNDYVLRYANQNCGGAAMTTWGSSDSNYLMRPTDDLGNKIMGSITCSSFTYYNLTTWRSATSYDTHSSNSPAFVTTSNATPFTNPTNATVNVTTSRMYKDASGTVYDGVVPLTAYEGLLLFDVGAATTNHQGTILTIRGRRVIIN